MIWPATSSSSNSFCTAGISLDFSSMSICASTNAVSTANALSTCFALASLKLSKLPLSALPSNAITRAPGPAASTFRWAYLNQEGRENGGIVPEADRRQVLDQIARRLKEFKDPVSGENVVDQIYFPDQVFRGKNLRYSPDLFVGFRRGFRASWQTALGAVPGSSVENNTQAWIGDHCMASDQVPGVLFSNRKIHATDPQLWDVTATILSEFGARKPANMIGQTVF